MLGVPIIVQHTQAEKNRVGNTLPNLAPKTSNGPTRLYVGSLHFNITEDMLRGIFEPFGKIDHIQLMTDPENGKSKGYGFLTVSIELFNCMNYSRIPTTSNREWYNTIELIVRFTSA